MGVLTLPRPVQGKNAGYAENKPAWDEDAAWRSAGTLPHKKITNYAKNVLTVGLIAPCTHEGVDMGQGEQGLHVLTPRKHVLPRLRTPRTACSSVSWASLEMQ